MMKTPNCHGRPLEHLFREEGSQEIFHRYWDVLVGALPIRLVERRGEMDMAVDEIRTQAHFG